MRETRERVTLFSIVTAPVAVVVTLTFDDGVLVSVSVDTGGSSVSVLAVEEKVLISVAGLTINVSGSRAVNSVLDFLEEVEWITLTPG